MMHIWQLKIYTSLVVSQPNILQEKELLFGAVPLGDLLVGLQTTI